MFFHSVAFVGVESAGDGDVLMPSPRLRRGEHGSPDGVPLARVT